MELEMTIKRIPIPSIHSQEVDNKEFKNVIKQPLTLTGNSSLVDSGFASPPENPLNLFRKWLEQAIKIPVSEPKGLVLSTVDQFHRPRSRVVLMKDCDETGVIFATSQNSAKGKDLEVNQWAAGTVWWRETVQQINFQGKVSKLLKEISDEVFQGRMREAQSVAVLSQQSMLLEDEKGLKDKIYRLAASKEKIERPTTWQAYHLTIESIEFWQGSQDRFHKRLKYDLGEGGWSHHRLQP